MGCSAVSVRGHQSPFSSFSLLTDSVSSSAREALITRPDEAKNESPALQHNPCYIETCTSLPETLPLFLRGVRATGPNLIHRFFFPAFDFTAFFLPRCFR